MTNADPIDIQRFIGWIATRIVLRHLTGDGSPLFDRLAKYYLRFLVSGFVIFLLIAGGVVNPLGLVIGLSVVVMSIILATIREVKKIIFKEAA